MDTKCPDLLDSAIFYTKQNICDNTLDDAQLVTRCPLDNGRHTDASVRPRCPAGQLDRLPAELLIQVLLYTDIPSLTCFRRVNRRAMELVDSVPQYAALIKLCPNVVRAILSVQADAYNCNVLFGTLTMSRCSTCERFGDHLCLIDCRRVCYFCLTRRPEYFPPHNRPRGKLLHSSRRDAAAQYYQPPTPTCGESPECLEPPRAVLYRLGQ